MQAMLPPVAVPSQSAPYTMNERPDNSPRAADTSGRPVLDTKDGPEVLARRMAGARGSDGRPRPFIQFVAQNLLGGGQDHAAGLRAHLEAGRVEEALALCIERLSPRHRDEPIRRIAFALLRRPAWRQRLMPLLRKHVVDRSLDPVPSGLFLYGRLQSGKLPGRDLTSPLVWAYAIVWLLDHCEPEEVRPMARHIADMFPKITFLNDVANGLEQVPPRLEQDKFHDHWTADVELARSADPHCRRLLVCFTGMFGRMGTPIGTFHRWASRTEAHVLYLKDLRRNFYRSGVVSLTREGHDPCEDLHVFLRCLADALGVERTGIYGISMGGIPAVEAGLAIGADRVVWAAGAIEREDRALPYDDPSEVARRKRTGEALLARITAASKVPEIACVFGKDFPNDAEMPLVLSAHPQVALHPLEGLSDHNIDFHLVKAGRFDRLVGWAACNGGPLELN